MKIKTLYNIHEDGNAVDVIHLCGNCNQKIDKVHSWFTIGKDNVTLESRYYCINCGSRLEFE